MRYSTNLGIEVLNHESGIMNYDFPATVRNSLLMIQKEKLPVFTREFFICCRFLYELKSVSRILSPILKVRARPFILFHILRDGIFAAHPPMRWVRPCTK